MLSLTKLFVGSDEVNVNSMDALLVVALLATFDDMSMVGRALSKVKAYCVAAVLPFPAESVNLSASTLIVHATGPEPIGLNVAV